MFHQRLIFASGAADLSKPSGTRSQTEDWIGSGLCARRCDARGAMWHGLQSADDPKDAAAASRVGLRHSGQPSDCRRRDNVTQTSPEMMFRSHPVGRVFEGPLRRL
jgi:hypothetical protein